MPVLLDNKGQGRVGYALAEGIQANANISILSSLFSIYGYSVLEKHLHRANVLRLLIPSSDNLTASKDLKPFRVTDLTGGEADRRFRNALNMTEIARRCSQWLREKAQIRAVSLPVLQNLFHIENPDGSAIAIHGSSPFTTTGLGFVPSNGYEMNTCFTAFSETESLLKWFNEIWSNPEATLDVKSALLTQLESICSSKSPEMVYFLTLYNVFREYLGELEEDKIIKTRTGIKDTLVWDKLYRFQRDGVLGAIDKMEKYNGCIIADSVGLGKTFEALAIIKYYELRNDRVLVLCPKKLRENWTIYTVNDKRNLFAADRFNYDVLIGNRLRLLDEDIHKNIKEIQLRNGLASSELLGSLDFTVEMETGTGKTYVYLRTIFEMNRLYGFTKFIIVVPSVAVKEGVYKSLQMTEGHFKGLYENVQFDYFVYDSQKLGQVRNFATSDYIQIMVINIDAFRKSFTDPDKEDKANIIHRPHDRMTGNLPIEFIQATNPIVIIDEPQSVDTTSKSKEAIASLNPICTLRYSATHVDKYHMMYKLDSVDAYQRKLVKQIEVSGIEVKDSHNKAFIRLLKVDNRKSPFTAQIEIDAMQRSGEVKRVKKTIRSGDDLLEISGGRSVYDGYIIEDIYCEKGNEYISFTSKPEFVKLDQAIGEVNDDGYKRLQIRKTIEKHLEKEMELRPKGPALSR